MRLLATRETYYKRTIHAGDEFEALDRHAKTLKALRHCVDAPIKPAAQAVDLAATETPAMTDLLATPVKPMTTEDAKAIVPARRGYSRRDLRAGEVGAVTIEPAAAGDESPADAAPG